MLTSVKEFKENYMRPLNRAYRNPLERTVKETRDVAETAALTILEQLSAGRRNSLCGTCVRKNGCSAVGSHTQGRNAIGKV